MDGPSADDPASPVVLLVEDDETFGRLIARHLDAHGYAVTIAATAEAATSALDRGLRPRLVLLDINLPGETGLSLVRGPALAAAGSPPVVVTSAMTVSPSRLRETGVAGYLPKPFALDTLRATIDRLLEPESSQS